MSIIRVATTWFDGCSGCHMSFLDIDERLVEIAGRIELVYSPIVDNKEFPDNVDVTLVEGAISNEHDEHLLSIIRPRTKLLISFGDCAITANVPSMRNRFPVAKVLERGYIENADLNQSIPKSGIPPLLKKARPVHEYAQVDFFLPGCPPSADTIYYAITELLDGRVPDIAGRTRFGA